MSGFEHYTQELQRIDREIIHWASVSGINPNDPLQLNALRTSQHATGQPNSTAETLRGLLMLRLKLETEMIEVGLTPAEFRGPALD